MNLKNFILINKKKIIYGAIIAVCFVTVFGLGIFVGNKTAYHVEQPATIDFSLFWDSYNKLSQNFVDPSKINNDKILYGAIEGMAKSLGDPYTAFFDPEQAKRFEQDLQGSFDGIGAEIGIKKDNLTIVAPIDGTPAQNAGLKAGDIIAKINDKDTTDMTADEAVNLIRGPKGTVVTLTIFRNGWTAVKDFKITRDTIKVASIKWELLASPGEAGGKNENIAYIKISQFDQVLQADFEKIADEIIRSNAKKIILDLRNNPGGYLDVSQTIAGWFLENGQTVTIEDFGKGKDQNIYKAQGNSKLLNYPIVVLVNEGSASASEILAGALRDNREVKLVGMKSFGKGSVQQVIDLKGGSFLKITIAKWLTPKGDSISEVGLTPDIKVEITDKDYEQNKDPQLDKALEIIKDLK